MSSMQINSEQIMVFAMKGWGVQPKAEKSDPMILMAEVVRRELTSHDTIPIQHECIKIYNVLDFGGYAAPISPRLPTQQLLKLMIHFSSGPNDPHGIVQSFTALKITFSKSPAHLQANF